MMRWLLTAFLFLCLSISSALAQDAIAVQYGAVTEGELNDSQTSVSYTFEGQSGDTIFMSAFNYDRGIDMVMRVFSPSGALLKEASGYLAAIIQPFELTADGRYTVVVERPSWSTQSGDFNFIVAEPQSRSFDGNRISGTFASAGEMLVATFQGEAGQIIDYSVSGRALGIYIYAPDGSEFVRDGYYDNLTAYSIYQLPTSGTYTVILQTLAAGGSSYNMTVRKISGDPIASGQTLDGEMLESERPIFSFESEAGQTWSISATLPDDGDRQIQVFKLEGRDFYNTFIASAYGGSERGVILDPFIAPETGRYYVILIYNNYEPDDARVPYSISLNPSEVVALQKGERYEGVVSPQRGLESFIYSATPGEVVRVTLELTSDIGSLALEVTTANNYVFSYSGAGTISRFSFDVTLDESTPYLFTVRDNSYSAFDMPFTISIEAAGE